MSEWIENYNKYGITLDYIVPQAVHIRLYQMKGTDTWSAYVFRPSGGSVMFCDFEGTAEEAKAMALLFL